jgi:NADPH:quinone reductase-like Zn-dependent oxidoreductase
MTMGSRILGVTALLIVAALLWFAYLVSHDAACGPSPVLPADTSSMKAIVYRCYGSPDVLRLESIGKPTPKADEVLVRVDAASVNPLDWHVLRGKPYIVRMEAGFGRPQDPRLGVDFAGTVEAVGASVTRFKPGDEVFGGHDGAFAEYLTVREERAVVPKPANATFEQAAALPIAAITALQALRDKGRLQSGQKVLINGASGGVGTFAVQIAKSYGAEVTGVCSARNVDMVRSLGADHVIDYTREDFTRSGQHYDLIVDTVGSHSLLAYRRALTPHGVLVVVGAANSGNWIGPLAIWFNAWMVSHFVSQEFVPLLAQMNKDDLAVLAGLVQSGKLTAVIDRRYPLSQVPDAIRYVEQGHARGKVVIDVE